MHSLAKAKRRAKRKRHGRFERIQHGMTLLMPDGITTMRGMAVHGYVTLGEGEDSDLETRLVTS